MKLALAVVTAALAAACLRSPSYHCASSAQCGAGGRCEANGYCSVADPSCSGGYRWASGAPDSGCVGAVVGGPDAPPSAHPDDVCWQQPRRAHGADACTDSVCAIDARCCDREWSDRCVQLAQVRCDHACGSMIASIGYGTVRVQQWDGSKLAPVWSKSTFTNTGDSSIAWGDVDGDHKPDLVTCESQSQTLPGKLCIWTNGGSCGEAFCQMKCVDIGDCYRVMWTDADADGDLDVAMFGPYVSQLWVNDQGLFGNTTYMPFGTQNDFSGAWADVDGDGQLDLALAQYEQPALLARVTNGGADHVTLSSLWNDAATDATARHKDMAFGDVDLDGHLDLVSSGEGLLEVWRNTSTGPDGFTADATPYYRDATYDAASIALVDADEDGDLDLVIADDGGHVQVLRNNASKGDKSITMTPFWSSGGSYGTARVVAADVDGDHHVDLVIGADEPTPGNSISVYLARGATGTFGDASSAATYDDPTLTHVTDVAATGAW